MNPDEQQRQRDRKGFPIEWGLFLAVFGMELGLLAAVLLLYRSTYKATWGDFFLSLPGLVLGVTVIGGGVLARVAGGSWRSLQTADRASRGRATLAANVLMLVGVWAGAEASLRRVAVPHIWGEEVHGMLLLPRGWDRIVERYTHMLKQMARQPSYYEEDPVLGWSIGPNRTSADGLFHSGPQRIRTPKRLMTYDQSAPCRVALVGDSFTFGEEALFEDTWGHYLQQALGSRCQVMNFAVPGYSIGQMFLRVQRDVLSFAPNLIIVGFTDGALERTMGVYCFLMGLEWPDCPWVAPRFVLREDDLVVTNSPLPQTDEIYSATTIRNLPAIAYDRWYQTSEWEQRNWDLLYQSYVFRYLTSLYPIHNVVSPDVSDESLRQVNGALFKAILGVGEQTGVRVLLVYLPMMEDFGYKVSYRAPVSHDILKSQGSNFLDLRDCLAQLREDHRFLERGIHYSPVGERRVAECLLPHVVKRLPKESSSAHATDS